LNRRNIVSLVIRLYNNLTFKYYDKRKLVKQVTFNSKYLRAKLNMLNLSIRFSMGLITDCQMRNYLAWSFKEHDWYPIPSTSTILREETLRVLGISIIPAIHSGMDSISKLQRRFAQY
jgi:hypothetical protein